MRWASGHPRLPRRGRRRDDGSATVFAIIVIGVLAAVAVGVSIVGGVVIAQRKAEAAADLAALAGASAVQDGTDGCATARDVAERNGGDLRSCEVRGEILTLWVERQARTGFGRTVTVTAQARAGPS